jgi:hypothetical protein
VDKARVLLVTRATWDLKAEQVDLHLQVRKVAIKDVAVAPVQAIPAVVVATVTVALLEVARVVCNFIFLRDIKRNLKRILKPHSVLILIF